MELTLFEDKHIEPRVYQSPCSRRATGTATDDDNIGVVASLYTTRPYILAVLDVGIADPELWRQIAAYGGSRHAGTLFPEAAALRGLASAGSMAISFARRAISSLAWEAQSTSNAAMISGC